MDIDIFDLPEGEIIKPASDVQFPGRLSIINGPKVPLLTCLQVHDTLKEIAKNPELQNKPAIIYQNTVVTFKQLYKKAQRISQCLVNYIKDRKEEAQPIQNIIGVEVEPSHNLIVILLSVLFSGAAYMPLDKTIPKDQMLSMIKEAKPSFILAKEHSAVYEMVPKDLVVTLEELEKYAISEDQNIDSINNDKALFCVMFTSGSTGKSKGVRITLRAVYNRLMWYWERFPFSSNEVCCFKTSLMFVDSIAEIFAPLLKGVPIVVVHRENTRNPETIVRILEEHRISRLVLVPSLLQMILTYFTLHSQTKHLRNLKLWVCSGEVMPPHLIRQFFFYFTDDTTFCNFYGSTELMGDVTYEEFKSSEDVINKISGQKLSIGRPINNTTIYLLSRKQEIVPIGEIGEIFVSGYNLALGYLTDGQDKFLPNFLSSDQGHDFLFKTGDLAHIQNNVLFYEGRLDSQMKVRGKWVDLLEMESCLKNIPGIEKVVVLCLYPGQENQELVAFYVKTSSEQNDLLKTHDWQRFLPNDIVPILFQVDEIPLLQSSCKTDKKSLQSMYESSKVSYVFENAEDENSSKKVCALINTLTSVLGFSLNWNLNYSRNFYDIGGNSLNSIMTISKLRQEGYSIAISDFLNSKNLLDILEHMKKCDPQMDNEAIDEDCGKDAEDFKIIPLEDVDKREAIDILALSFYVKDEFMKSINEDHRKLVFLEMRRCLDVSWLYYVNSGLSFCVANKENRLLGVSISMDFEFDICDHNYKPLDNTLSHFYADIEEDIIPQLPKKSFNSYLIGTLMELKPSDNLNVVLFIEKHNIELAKKMGFDAIVTANTNPLTQQLAADVLGFKILKTVKGNDYVSRTGKMPFHKAPDNVKAIISIKYV